jgi:hypothetical protein
MSLINATWPPWSKMGASSSIEEKQLKSVGMRRLLSDFSKNA